MPIRIDQKIILEWIQPESSVLDLGCGDGKLLNQLMKVHNVTGYGVEIDVINVTKCIFAGINVIHKDLNGGLSDFDNSSFDYVIMSQAIQAIKYPDKMIDEMLRVGRQGIVTFPNFAYWRHRFDMFFGGKMPTSKSLPHSWYETPNIHLCTVRDFELLCKAKGIEILQRVVIDHAHHAAWCHRLLPNIFGEIALYRFQRKLNKKGGVG